MTSFVYPRIDSQVSTSNSTSTPLLASATFTGTGEVVTDFSTISFIMKSDVSGTLLFQFSSDNVNWDISTTYSLSAGVGQSNIIAIPAKYFRIVYTNGASNQTYFRLQVVQHKEKAVPPIAQNAISAVSTLNSTSTPLIASAAFTGTGEVVNDYSSVTITLYSDVAGVCSLQQSSDNTNWDIIKQVSVSATTQCVMEMTVVAKYMRVVYTNGASNQTYFRLQTLYHTNKSVVDGYDINTASVVAGYTMTTNLAESLVSANIHRKMLSISVTGYDVFIRLIPSTTSNGTRMGIFLPINSTITLTGPDIYKGAISCFNTTAGQTPTLYVTEY
jgi:hypothetical protein